MADFYIKETNIPKTDYPQNVGTPVAVNNTLPNSVVPGGAEGVGNVDTTTTNNTSNVVVTTQRSVDELYNAIASLCTKYGISLSDVKNFALFERITGMPEKALLNLPNGEIQKYVECLKAALEKLSPNGEKVDLEALAKLANNYNIAIHTGWTIEGFEKVNKSNNENLQQRLARFFGKPDLDLNTLSKEKLENILDRYFNGFFQEKIAEGKSPEEVYKLQLQDFGKLLINTPDSQKQFVMEAVKSLVASNRQPGLKALFESFESLEAASELADSMTLEDKKELLEADIENNRPEFDDATDMFHMIDQRKTEDGLQESHAEYNADRTKFFEEHADELRAIDEKINSTQKEIAEKIKSGKDLTKEDLEILSQILTPEELDLLYQREVFHKAASVAEFTGTASNYNASQEFIEQMLTTINEDAYQLPDFYRDVLAEVAEYVKENPQTLTMSQDAFKELMDKVTNDNYSTVINDVAKGTTSELNNPHSTTEVEVPEQVQNASVVKPASVQEAQQRLNQVQQKIVQSVEQEQETSAIYSEKAPKTFNEALKKGVKGVIAYITSRNNNMSNSELTLELLKSSDQNVVELGLNRFEAMNDSMQKLNFTRINKNSSAMAAANLMKTSALESVKNFCTNFALKQGVEELIRDKQENTSLLS